MLLTSITFFIFDADMKRGCKSSSSDQLTGGSGDVNPQILQFINSHDFLNQTGSQGFVHTFPNPIWDLNRSIQLGCDKTKAFVMEILGIWLINDPPPINSGMASNSAEALLNWSSLSYDQAPAPPLPVGSGYLQTWEWVMDMVRGVAQNDTNILAAQADATNVSSNSGVNGSPWISQHTWDFFDLTDGQGHGVLVGAPVFNLRTALRFLPVVPGGTGTFVMGCRIKYRVKAISYQEFVRQFTFGI